MMEHRLTQKLNIGLIVDSALVSKYVYDLVEWSRRQDNLTISHLVIQRDGRSRTAKFIEEVHQRGLTYLVNRLAFAVLTRVENLLLAPFSSYKDHLAKRDVSTLVGDSISVFPEVSKSGYVYRYSKDDVEKLKSLHFDLLLRGGSGILRGDILSAARHGVISFHHADNRIIRGAPPGFWEVFYGHGTTGVTIQKLTAELDGGEVLFRGSFPTKSYFFLYNQAFLYKNSNVHMKRLLSRIAETQVLEPIVTTQPYFNRLYKMPSAAQTAVYALKQAGLLSKKLVTKRLLRKEPRWGVAFAHGDWRNLVMWRATRITNPPYHFLADPFVVERNGRTICYVEDYDYRASRACIAAYELTNSSYQRLGEVIREPFHMSFPYLFEYNGELYMCPETNEKREIRLYKCRDFPLKWDLSAILMADVSAADTMIFERAGLWWLLTSNDSANSGDYCSELNVFYSRDPLSTEWTPHAGNPVIVDASTARNGGLLVERDTIYRVAQRQGFGMYGVAFSINKVTSLSTHEYAEVESGSVAPNFYPSLIGTHHLHSNGKMTVFDYCARSRVSK